MRFLLVLLVSTVIVCGQNVNKDHPWLKKLATSPLNTGATGTCVRTTLNNMIRLQVPAFPGGTATDPNNPRGSMVLMFKTGKWTSLPLPGAVKKTITSPYGTIDAYVISADKYKPLATAGEIPSGALVWQTKHGWGYSGGSSGNDLAIVRNGGKAVFNYQMMNFPLVYRDCKEVVVGVPTDALNGSGGDSQAAGADTAGSTDAAQQEEGPQDSDPNKVEGQQGNEQIEGNGNAGNGDSGNGDSGNGDSGNGDSGNGDSGKPAKKPQKSGVAANKKPAKKEAKIGAKKPAKKSNPNNEEQGRHRRKQGEIWGTERWEEN